MAYDAPTRSEMRVAALRSLRDPGGSVFASDVVNGFIDEALSDLGNYRAKEAHEVADWPLSVVPPVPFSSFVAVWMVQSRVAVGDNPGDVRVTTIPVTGHGSGDARAGWEFYQHQVVLSDSWVARLTAITDQGRTCELAVWGYADRDLPVNDADVLDLEDNTDYLCVLNHCKHLGFELLNHDRSLYQQWLAATNNTDVSPTQLQGMAASAEQTFDRMRSRNVRLRRIPAGDLAYTY